MGDGRGVVGANDSDSTTRPARVLLSLVPAGGRFHGCVVARDAARVDGHVVGSVRVEGHLTAGAEAHIEGDVEASELTLSGRVDGAVTVARRAHLESGATVRGTLRVPNLRMDEGATLEGRCQAGEPDLEPDSRS